MSDLPPRTSTPDAATLAAAAADDDRRSLHRLRDLCDEVIVARQVDAGDEAILPAEREEARQMLRQIAPRIGMRERPRG